MTSIGIVGSGISGLHLALRLQQHGVPTKLYAEQAPSDLRKSPPQNFATRFDNTRARERILGVDHWDSREFGSFGIRFGIEADPRLTFHGHLSAPANGVDFRIYLPTLMEDYAARGGTIAVGQPDLSQLAEKHDLLVISTGGRSQKSLFPPVPARSPFSAPQRLLCGGLFTGLAFDRPMGVSFHICPGAGEVFTTPFLTFGGQVHSLLVEAIPGGPFEPLAHLRHDDDPAAFTRTLLDLLARFVPPLRERVDESEFGLTRPVDLLQGAITPTVRRGWTKLSNGRGAIAIGDTWVTNDPIIGQGANLGSHNAFTLADLILAGPPFDDTFCATAERTMWTLARSVTEWGNSFLLPPTPQLLQVLGTAAHDQRIADEFVELFDNPAEMWHTLSTPEQATTWLSGRAHLADLAELSHD